MTWAVSASGTTTATIGTEFVLASDATNGTYYFQVRGNNLVIGDVLELRIYTQTLTTTFSTPEVTWKTTIGPSPPAAFVIASPPQPSDISIKVTLKQVAGTARSIDWKLLRT
ncbi:hypothetical protein [Rhodopila sp.]|uniref:hypothetical protein n=1 Tax=Rhodopila sp. TaxID=2480087 RepID=UPI003D0A83C7